MKIDFLRFKPDLSRFKLSPSSSYKLFKLRRDAPGMAMAAVSVLALAWWVYYLLDGGQSFFGLQCNPGERQVRGYAGGRHVSLCISE